ncbi:MAG: hypothetical protein ABSG85_20335 [Spirochaetia bacterium]
MPFAPRGKVVKESQPFQAFFLGEQSVGEMTADETRSPDNDETPAKFTGHKQQPYPFLRSSLIYFDPSGCEVAPGSGRTAVQRNATDLAPLPFSSEPSTFSEDSDLSRYSSAPDHDLYPRQETFSTNKVQQIVNSTRH